MIRPARGAYRMNRAAPLGVSVVPPLVGAAPAGVGKVHCGTGAVLIRFRHSRDLAIG
jgi:hypothetical protein